MKYISRGARHCAFTRICTSVICNLLYLPAICCTIASSSEDRTVKLWQQDGTNGRYYLSKTLQGHSAGVWGVAFSPDKRIVASRSVDTTIKLWTLNGIEISTLRGHMTAIRRLAISRDGTLLVSGGDDNAIILWNLPQILSLDALTYSCKFARNYLKTNVALEESEREAQAVPSLSPPLQFNLKVIFRLIDHKQLRHLYRLLQNNSLQFWLRSVSDVKTIEESLCLRELFS